jgi:type II secretory pathway pseudopilin PulG
MIQKIKNQNISYKAFTLIEMLIVFVIIWIMLMATVFLSWEQIQKVKDKTVKESIMAEMQSRYSRNLWSSSFAWLLYSTMDVTFSTWENKINFKYNARSNSTGIENTFSDRFEIKYITKNYKYDGESLNPTENITLKYTPYQISCQIWSGEDSYNNAVIVTRVNDNKDYCFEINQKNCRLLEVSSSKCCILEIKAGLQDNNCN